MCVLGYRPVWIGNAEPVADPQHSLGLHLTQIGKCRELFAIEPDARPEPPPSLELVSWCPAERAPVALCCRPHCEHLECFGVVGDRGYLRFLLGLSVWREI